MPRPPKAKTAAKDATSNLGLEDKYRLAAHKLGKNMGIAVVRALSFRKDIPERFEAHYTKLKTGEGDYSGPNPDDTDKASGARQTAAGSPKGEHGGPNQNKTDKVFWVPADTHWSHLLEPLQQSHTMRSRLKYFFM